MSSLRIRLANGVWALHFGVVAFFVVGWLLAWGWALWTVAVGVPALQLTWQAFGDRCPLTMLEARLRGPAAVEPVHPDDGGAERSYVGELLSRILGWRVSERLATRIVHGVTWFAFSAAVIRLALADPILSS